MSWRKKLEKAQLGSAYFLVERAETPSIGRRVQLHEYVQSDTPFAEDLGKKPQQHTLQAYVIGPDYMDARDKLVAELNKPGRKKLVHPYLGGMTVVVLDPHGPEESTREGGMARFSFTVVKVGDEALTPRISSDFTAKQKAAALKRKWTDGFDRAFSVATQPLFVAQSATQNVQALATDLRRVTANITTIPTQISAFMNAVSNFSGAASNLILMPQTLASNVHALFEQARVIVNGPINAMNLMRSMVPFGSMFPYLPLTTPARIRQSNNQNAFASLVRHSAIATALQVSADMAFDSQNDALALRDELITIIDAQLESLDSVIADDGLLDDIYFAMVDARSTMVTDLETRGAQLPLITRVQLPETTPAIVLAYRRYQDATRDADIVARNRVRDPSFLYAGEPLEVLSE